MIRIIIQIITILIIGFIEFERGIIPIDSLVFSVLLGFSFCVLINILNRKKLKFIFFGGFLIFAVLYPQYYFLIIILASSAFLNFKILGMFVFLPLMINFDTLYLALGVLLFIFDYVLVKREKELYKLKIDKLNLVENINKLNKSMDILKIEAEREENLAIQDERNRISREIHDTAGHAISASIINLKALSLVTKDKEVKSGILDLKENLEKGLQDIRNVMYDLRDSSFDLENKIMELLETLDNSSFTYIINSNLSYGVKYDIYGIIREGVTNFIKHSSGENFKVYFVENQYFLVLKIEDDGQYLKNDFNEGLGLYSIKKKCEERDWKLNILKDDGFGIHILMEKNNENFSS